MSFGISGYNRPYSYAGSAGSAGGAGSAGASGSAANAGSASGVGSSSGAGSTSAAGSASGTRAILGKDSSSTSRSTVTYAASIKVYDDSNVADAIEAAMRGEIGSAGAMDNVANYLGSLGFTGSLGSMGAIRNFLDSLGSTALGSLASSVPYDPVADYDNDWYGENSPLNGGTLDEVSIGTPSPTRMKEEFRKAAIAYLRQSAAQQYKYVHAQQKAEKVQYFWNMQMAKSDAVKLGDGYRITLSNSYTSHGITYDCKYRATVYPDGNFDNVQVTELYMNGKKLNV